jgi:hypothetical protein
VRPDDVERAFDGSTLAARIQAGVPQGQAKRQHFTPQLLLRRFLAPGATHLCQLDVTTGQPQPVSVASAASRRRFYTLRNTGSDERDETIEGLFSLIEDAAARALETVISTPTTTTADERVTLAYFAAAQLVRTPSALARMQAIGRVVHVAEMARLIVDDATFAEGYAAVRDEQSSEDPAWLQSWMREALLDDRIRVTNEHELSLSTMVDLLDDYAVRLFCMPWSLLSGSGETFITSDSGLGVIDRERDSFQQVSVLGSRDARLLMPISSGHCIQIGPLGPPTIAVPPTALTPGDTTLVNMAVYGWAGRHIFADRQTTAVDVRMAAKRAPAAAERPRPFTQHALIERDPDDDSLAQAHRRVGRVPHVEHDGETYDYVVLRDDKDLPRQALRALALSKARAERRTGTTDLRSGSEVLSPLDIRRPGRRD